MEKTTHTPEPAAPKVDPLAEFEEKARLFVRFEGADPDERVNLPSGNAVAVYTQRWRVTAAALRRHHLYNGLLYGVAPAAADQSGDSQVDLFAGLPAVTL